MMVEAIGGNKTGQVAVIRDERNPEAPEDKQSPPSNREKGSHDWAAGDETMTGAQASYLKTLSEEAGAVFDPSLSKAHVSITIDALRKATGRGRDH